MQVDVGVGLRPRDLFGTEHALAEDLGERRALQRIAHAHEPAVRHDGGRQRDLQQCVAHAADRRERLRERDFDVVLDGFDEVGGHLDAEAGFDAGEEARRLLAECRLRGGFEIEVGERGGQRVEQHAVGDDFAVDEHAVAVADEVIEHGDENAGYRRRRSIRHHTCFHAPAARRGGKFARCGRATAATRARVPPVVRLRRPGCAGRRRSRRHSAITRPVFHDVIAASASSSAASPSSIVVRTGVPSRSASTKCAISAAYACR